MVAWLPWFALAVLTARPAAYWKHDANNARSNSREGHRHAERARNQAPPPARRRNRCARTTNTGAHRRTATTEDGGVQNARRWGRVTRRRTRRGVRRGTRGRQARAEHAALRRA